MPLGHYTPWITHFQYSVNKAAESRSWWGCPHLPLPLPCPFPRSRGVWLWFENPELLLLRGQGARIWEVGPKTLGGSELAGEQARLFPRPRARRQWDFKRLSAVVRVRLPAVPVADLWPILSVFFSEINRLRFGPILDTAPRPRRPS